MNVINLTQRTAEWHTWRAAGVTASEAAVILNRSPYKTPWRLWAERTGVTTPEDLSSKPCVQRGIQFEDQVRRGFEERHGTILLPLCAESSKHPVLRASLDGLSDDGAPVELKVPTDKTYQRVVSEGEQALAYRLAWVQLQHQLYVTQAQQGWLVFDPCRAGSAPLEFAIERDEGFLRDELVPACMDFWEHIQKGKAPPPDPSRDLYLPDGTALTQWTEAASDYRKLAEERQHLEQRLDALKASMAAHQGIFASLMGDFLLAETAGLRISRYWQRGSVDYQAVLKDVAPDLDSTVLERHRRKPSERVRVTLQGGADPADQSRPQPAATAASFYF